MPRVNCNRRRTTDQTRKYKYRGGAYRSNNYTSSDKKSKLF